MSSHDDENLDPRLEEAVSATRDEPLEAEVIEQAAARVWTRLLQERQLEAEPARGDAIRGCPDFRALIPLYLEGTLSRPRALLLEDHTRECVSCRAALGRARGEMPQPAARPASGGSSSRGYWTWAVAAALVLGLGLLQLGVVDLLMGHGSSTITGLSGSIHRITSEGSVALAAGDRVEPGERIRTAKGSWALLELSDGSLVEVAERSELSCSSSGADLTVRLQRGNVIVRAAGRTFGSLRVLTNECQVAVKGTVFAVSHGTKGSRVSVLEGEVWVTQGERTTPLQRGEQLTTRTALSPAPLREEFEWSREKEIHLALLREISALEQEIVRLASTLGLRHSSRLLDLVPEGTVFYAAIPNLGVTLAEAHNLLTERIQNNELLRRWYERNAAEIGELEEVLQKLGFVGAHLGDEIVLVMVPEGAHEGPTLLAELSDDDAFRAFLQAEIESGDVRAVRIVADPLNTPAPEGVGIFVYIGSGLFVATPSYPLLQTVVAALNDPGSNPFTAGSFHARLSEAYAGGVSWVFGADIEGLVRTRLGGEREGEERALLERSGILNARHLIVQRRETEGKNENRAVLTFTEERRGVTSWLEEPGPMGALDFISPDATLASALILKDPALMLEDLFGVLEVGEKGFREELEHFQTQHGVDFRRDFAAPLGGEMAFAFDGPLLPSPSWKVIVEVYDEAAFQSTLETLLDQANRISTEHGRAGLELTRESLYGQLYYTLTSLDTGFEVHYTYSQGYLIAAPSRALLDLAIEYKSTGYSLSRSETFAGLLPQDGFVHFSGIFYQNFGSALDSLIQQLPEVGTRSPEATAMIEMAGDVPPTLVAAYGAADEITVASLDEGGLFQWGRRALGLGGGLSAIFEKMGRGPSN